MNNKGKASTSTAIPSKVPRLGSGGSNTEDEMVSWLQYPLEGTLERGYCSELFGRSSLTSFGKAKADARKAVPNIRENDSSSTTRTENNEDELALGAGRASGFVMSEGAEAFNKVKTRMQQASCPPHPVQCSSLQVNGETLKLHSSIVYQGCSQTNPFPENHHAYHGAHDLHNMWLPALPASAQQSLQRTQFSNHAAALSSARDSSDVLHSLTSRAGSDAWAQEMNPRGSSYGHVGEEHASLYAVSGGQMVPNWTYSHDAGTPTGAGTALEEGHGTEISGDMFVEGIDVPSCSRGSRSSAELSVKETSSVGKQKVDDFDCQSKNAEVDLVAELSQPHKSLPKRSRAAESHNLSEKRRRNRINERLRTLQELIPNSTKTDKASILDEAIEYLKALQSQLQMMSSRSGVRLSPMSMPSGMQHLQMAQMAPVHHVGIGLPYMHAGVGLGMGVMDLSHGVDGRTFQALPAVPPHCGLMYPMAAAVSPQACRGQSYPTGMDAPSSNFRAMEQQASAQPYQPVHVEPQAGSSVEMHQQEEQLVSSRDSKDS